jgi:hypothetical protein
MNYPALKAKLAPQFRIGICFKRKTTEITEDTETRREKCGNFSLFPLFLCDLCVREPKVRCG